MRLSSAQPDPRRGSSRLIVLVALAVVAAGAFYFVGTGSDESGDEPAAPRKRSVSKSKPTNTFSPTSSPKHEGDKTPDTKVASIPEPKPMVVPEAKPAAMIQTKSAETATTVITPVEMQSPDKVKTPPAVAIPAKIARYAALIFNKYDVDGSGKLESKEWETAPGLTRETDLNADGAVSLDELIVFVAGYGRSRKLRLVAESAEAAQPGPTQSAEGKTSTTDSAPKGAAPRTDRRFFVTPKRVPQGLPDWFLEKDGDGDLQLTLAEYSPTSLRAELDEFAKLDINSDGLLTADEYIRSASAKPATPEKGTAGTPPAPVTPAK